MTVTIKSSGGLQKFADQLKKDAAKTLEIGLLTSEQATIAAQQEFGGTYAVSEDYKIRAKAKGIDLPDQLNIPARPFMQVTFDKEKDNWGKKFNQLFTKSNDVEQSLRILGNIVKTDIQKTITNANALFQENSARTIKIKEKDTVLRDSGEMLNSINFDVVTK